MTDLYSVISGIEPDQQDVLEAELLAKQILEAKYPDLDLREGTGIRDLVIRPSSFLLALCKKGFDYYFSQNTLDKVDDTSPTELVDDLLSNLFLTRNTGSYSVINARLYFARQKSVSLNTNVSFSTDGSLLFFPSVNTTFPPSALQYDSFQNEWFLDIDLVAGEKGISYNISSGSLLYFSNFDPFFLHGEINYLAQSSIAPETNSQFITRAKSAISTRNLINNPSIVSKLTSDFNYLNRISTVGAGDSGMYRDQVKVLGGPGVSLTASAMALTDSGTKMQVTLTAHPYIEDQLVDVVESGSSPTKFVVRGARVTDVLNADNFKVLLPVTPSPRTFLYPVVTAVEDAMYVHQGGAVDIHCSESVGASLSQFTLDSSGKCTVSGPVYKISRSLTSGSPADTVPALATFSTRVGARATDTAVSFSQEGDGTVTVNMKSHPLVEGRMINIVGWPTSISDMYLSVTSVTGSDTFKVGRGLPLYTVGTGLTPSVSYTYPAKDTGFSTRQEIIVDFGSTHAGQLVTLQLNAFDHLSSIQAYLDLSENRVICADYLARGFDIYVLDINLVVYGTILPASGYAASIIQSFLSKLPPGADFILSDLVASLTSSGDITNLQTPLTVGYTYYSKDLFPGKTGTVTDVLVPENSISIYVPGNITTSLANP